MSLRPNVSEMDECDFQFQDRPVCPHCGADFPVWEEDYPLDLNYDDGGQTEFKCPDCRKSFVAVTVVNYQFHTAIDEDCASDELWGPQSTSAPSTNGAVK